MVVEDQELKASLGCIVSLKATRTWLGSVPRLKRRKKDGIKLPQPPDVQLVSSSLWSKVHGLCRGYFLQNQNTIWLASQGWNYTLDGWNCLLISCQIRMNMLNLNFFFLKRSGANTTCTANAVCFNVTWLCLPSCSLNQNVCFHLGWMEHTEYLEAKSLLRRFVQHRKFPSLFQDQSDLPGLQKLLFIDGVGVRDTISLRTSQSCLIWLTKTNPAAWATKHLKMWITTATQKLLTTLIGRVIIGMQYVLQQMQIWRHQISKKLHTFPSSNDVG